MFFLHNFKNDCVLQALFLSKSDATQSVILYGYIIDHVLINHLK